jgi:hypothetical protein
MATRKSPPTGKSPSTRKSPTTRRRGPVAGGTAPPSVSLRPLALDAVLRDYGFGVTVSVLAIDRGTGLLIAGLDASHFVVTAVQSPTGWAHEQVLRSPRA